MTNIVLCGDSGDSSVQSALISALSLYGGVKYAGPGHVFERGVEGKFFLCECGEIPRIELSSGILLFQNGIRQQNPFYIPANFFCVLHSKNSRAAALLKDTEAAVVTCGTSARDTISIAALGSAALGSAGTVLSLQRSLPTVDGKLLEPHDFSVTCSQERSPSQLLAVCAVLLLSGVDSAEGYII